MATPILESHPQYRQMVAEADAARRALAFQQLEAEAQMAKQRLELLGEIREEYARAVSEYEVARIKLHADLLQVWRAVRRHIEVVHVAPPGFPEPAFMAINLPTLIPSASPWAGWTTPMSTTHTAVQGYQHSMCKEWPSP